MFMIALAIIKPAQFAIISFTLKNPFFALESFNSFDNPAAKLSAVEIGNASDSELLYLFTRTYWHPSEIKQL